MIDYIAMRIIDDTCSKHGLSKTEIISPRRQQRLMACRIEIARELSALGLSTPQIGKLMNRDHSSILNQLKGGRSGLKSNPSPHGSSPMRSGEGGARGMAKTPTNA